MYAVNDRSSLEQAMDEISLLSWAIRLLRDVDERLAPSDDIHVQCLEDAIVELRLQLAARREAVRRHAGAGAERPSSAKLSAGGRLGAARTTSLGR